MRFRARVLLGGKTASGIRVPPEVVAGLGASKRPAVRVTIQGYTYRSTVAPMHGEYMLPVSAEVRDSVGIAAGEEVEVELELDTGRREVTIPTDFKDALDSDAVAKQFFDGLSYSNQRRLVMAIDGANATDTRQRRIAKTVSTLREHRT